VRKADNIPPSCADVKKSGGLNFLETCGPVQASNGTGLPFYIIGFLPFYKGRFHVYFRYCINSVNFLIFAVAV
jgi:hypothetical protein